VIRFINQLIQSIMQNTVEAILKFWFEETDPRQWDHVNAAFDFELQERFELTYTLAGQGLCEDWRNTPEGSLAYILLMGVFPHHIYRGQHKAYAYNDLAIKAAKETVQKGFDQLFQPNKRKFLYVPLMNSVHNSDVELAVSLYKKIAKHEPIFYARAQRLLSAAKTSAVKPSQEALSECAIGA
jgi:uncharacterized protein (DUF924 family)